MSTRLQSASLCTLLALVLPACGLSDGDTAQRGLDDSGADFDIARVSAELCGDDIDNDGDGSIDEDCTDCDAFVTRDIDWWGDASCVIGGDANDIVGLPITLGTSDSFTTATDVTDALAGTSFSGHAKLQRQLLALSLNADHFGLWDVPVIDWEEDGDLETVVWLWERANTFYDTGTDWQQQFWAAQIREINRAGLGGGLWFDPDCVDDPEYCDGVDNDGDGLIDEDCSCEEICDGVDNDGDGEIDEGWGDDGSGDCVLIEACNGVDDDGDGLVDEDCSGCDMVVTRGPDWWVDMECALDGSLGVDPFPISIGSSASYSSAAEVITFLATDVAGDPTLRLERQLLALRLNIAYFDLADADAVDIDFDGDIDTFAQVAAFADGIYDTGLSWQKARMATLLRVPNSLGDALDAWFDETCAGAEACDGVDDGVTCGCVEVCDGMDNDDNGVVDDGYPDTDGDGYADCIDDEQCDGIDNDGDGEIDEGLSCDTADLLDCEAPTDCLSIYQAHSLGIVDIVSDGAGEEVVLTNLSDDYSICIDEQIVYMSDSTQAFFWDEEVILAGTEVGPGETFSSYYGSWTTDNGVYSPYLDEDAWWCLQINQPVSGGASFTYAGEIIPDDIAELVLAGGDSDGDGVDDLIDWADVGGVQAQYDIWAYQEDHAVLTAGKQATGGDCGLDVTLTVRNIGMLDGDGVLTDIIPAGWTISDLSVAADTSTTEGDGSTTLTWDLSVAGMDGADVSAVTITYSLSYDAGADLAQVDLPAAAVDYDDGEGAETSWSVPAVAFDADLDCDGELDCPEEEICDGVDNDHDGSVDEGYDDSDGDGIADCVDEECDGVDNDGDGLVDEDYADTDGDGIADCVDVEVCDDLDNDGDGDVDEGSVCPLECDEPTACLSIWEAHALGAVEIVSDGGTAAQVTVTNTGSLYDVCLDEQVLYISDDTQSFFWEEEITTGPLTLGPGDSHAFFYGSWTTDNGTYSPYLGDDAWWCVDNDTYAAAGATFDYSGEGVPTRIAQLILAGNDGDSDGVDDREDWAGSYGVEAQYAIWDYQATHTVISVGKVGSSDGCGVDIDLTARNNGDIAGSGTVSDTLPAGWSLDSASVSPDSTILNGDGTTTLVWTVSLDGKLAAPWDTDVISYSTSYDAGLDLGYQRFEAASVEYDDGDGLETSWSMPVGLFDLDNDCDGAMECPGEEVCDGADNDHDGSVDEGFDSDGDGVADCFDVEECDGLDNDGDGSVDEGFDSDGDGVADCFDVEECDGLDNDGDGSVDEGFDSDGDGVADCFDVEECDGLDNDGDGSVDEGFDSDGDGLADCFDREECDGVDNDGDGSVDEGFDSDGDGVADCFDREECDGVDNDGDGDVDEGFDSDGDGVADCFDVEECDGLDNDGDGEIDEGYADTDGDGTPDCLDGEECDGLDNDGDGLIDEDNICGDDFCDPPVECLSLWQAHSLDLLLVESGGGGEQVIVTNLSDDRDICLDEQVVYYSDDTQAFFWGLSIVTLPTEIGPGDSYTLYYGSYTTDNGVYSPYLDEPDWWCLQSEDPVVVGAPYSFFGEGVPDALAAYAEAGFDTDGSGTDDLLDWVDYTGVQGQFNIWDYQAVHTALTVGKLAAFGGPEVDVTLTVHNFGEVSGSGVVTDFVPAGWTLGTATPTPDSTTAEGDGSTTLEWSVTVAGMDGATVYGQTITYSMTYDAGTDLGYLELDVAGVAYDAEAGDSQISLSVPAAVYNLDIDGDGSLECPED